MTDAFSLGVAARTVWMEARGEGEAGQRAVAHVLTNQLASGRWGKSLASVCLLPFQFSCWNDTDPNRRAVLALADDDAALAAMAGYVADALAGATDPTHGATHYYAQSLAAPPRWARGRTPTAEIGRHRFFRLDGG